MADSLASDNSPVIRIMHDTDNGGFVSTHFFPQTDAE